VKYKNVIEKANLKIEEDIRELEEQVAEEIDTGGCSRLIVYLEPEIYNTLHNQTMKVSTNFVTFKNIISLYKIYRDWGNL
jgi:hypothetical protein